MSYQTPEQMKWLRELASDLRRWHWRDDSEEGIQGSGLADRIDAYLKISGARYTCRHCAKDFIHDCKPCDVPRPTAYCCHFGETGIYVVSGVELKAKCSSHGYGCGMGVLIDTK